MEDINISSIVTQIKNKLSLFKCKSKTISAFTKEIDIIIYNKKNVTHKLNLINETLTQECNTLTEVKRIITQKNRNIPSHKIPFTISNPIINSQKEEPNFQIIFNLQKSFFEDKIEKYNIPSFKEINILIPFIISIPIIASENKNTNFQIILNLQKSILENEKQNLNNINIDKIYKSNLILLNKKLKINSIIYDNNWVDNFDVFKLSEEINVLKYEITNAGIIIKLNKEIERLNALLFKLIDTHKYNVKNKANILQHEQNNDIFLLNNKHYLSHFSNEINLCNYIYKYSHAYTLINKYKIDLLTCENIKSELKLQKQIVETKIKKCNFIKVDLNSINDEASLLNKIMSKLATENDNYLRIQNLLNFQETQLKFTKNNISDEVINIEKKNKKNMLNNGVKIFAPKYSECNICYENKHLYKTYKCEHYICKRCYLSIEISNNNHTCSFCRSDKKINDLNAKDFQYF